MATLHVRNVPDGVYEQLRERAAGNGRSIGAELVVLLESELLGTTEASGNARRRFPQTLRRRAASTPFERFSDRSRQVVADALETAAQLRAPALGTEHLLLALFRDPPTIALMVLDAAGLDESAVRSAVEAEHAGLDAPPATTGMPFTPGAKKALEVALREYIDTGDIQIEPEHLLVGISVESDGLGARILNAAGQDAAEIRAAICMPRSLPAFAQLQPQQGFRVLELAGEAGDWERELNTFAARGYSLVQIVGGRAIFAVSISGP
jgi:Clp amino terminal domain, pathogenicity island component/Arc-like DNA binding domain